MKPVVIDRGIYHLGINNSSIGEKTEPRWERNSNGGSIVIGHEDEEFAISHIEDIDFIIKELNERLKLNLGIRKYECGECEGELYVDIHKFDNPLYCPHCGEEIGECF